MAALLDVLTHLDDELDVPAALLEALYRPRTSLLHQDLNVFFEIDQVSIDAVDLLLPLEGINAGFNYLLVFIELLLLRIKEVHLRLLSEMAFLPWHLRAIAAKR